MTQPKFNLGHTVVLTPMMHLDESDMSEKYLMDLNE